MIFDQLRNERLYRNLRPEFTRAFDYLTTFDPQTADGKYTLEGERVFAVVQSYETKSASEKRYEAHQKYIDIQYLVSGEEVIFHAPLDRLAETQVYLPEKDCALYSGEDTQALQMGAGDFAIFFPEDAHKPSCQTQQPGAVKKVVIKIAV